MGMMREFFVRSTLPVAARFEPKKNVVVQLVESMNVDVGRPAEFRSSSLFSLFFFISIDYKTTIINTVVGQEREKS